MIDGVGKRTYTWIGGPDIVDQGISGGGRVASSADEAAVASADVAAMASSVDVAAMASSADIAAAANVDAAATSDASGSVTVLDRVDIDEKDVREEANRIFGSKVRFPVKVAIVIGLIAAFFISFAMGKYPISPVDLVTTIYNHFFNPAAIAKPQFETVIFNIRLPRVLVAMIVGAALSVSGAAFQGMFKNPLVSPDILGASAGASFGACLALLLNMPSLIIQLWAFIGGIVAVGMAVWLNRIVRYDPILGLVLGGILVSSLFQAGLSLVKFTADADDKLPTITFWLMGSFSSTNLTDLVMILPAALVGITLLLSQRANLNALSFGEEEARSLGVNTRRTRLIVIVASTLLTSISVAVAGVIGWIGLVIPHLARAIVGPNYRVLLPVSMAVGASYLLIVDDLARMLSTLEIPIGILTAILGVPFFVVIFKHNMKGWQ